MLDLPIRRSWVGENGGSSSRQLLHCYPTGWLPRGICPAAVRNRLPDSMDLRFDPAGFLVPYCDGRMVSLQQDLPINCSLTLSVVAGGGGGARPLYLGGGGGAPLKEVRLWAHDLATTLANVLNALQPAFPLVE